MLRAALRPTPRRMTRPFPATAADPPVPADAEKIEWIRGEIEELKVRFAKTDHQASSFDKLFESIQGQMREQRKEVQADLEKKIDGEKAQFIAMAAYNKWLVGVTAALFTMIVAALSVMWTLVGSAKSDLHDAARQHGELVQAQITRLERRMEELERTQLREIVEIKARISTAEVRLNDVRR